MQFTFSFKYPSRIPRNVVSQRKTAKRKGQRNNILPIILIIELHMFNLKIIPQTKRMTFVSIFAPRSTVTSRNPLWISDKRCCQWRGCFGINFAPAIEKFCHSCSNYAIPILLLLLLLFSSSYSSSLLDLVLPLHLHRLLLKYCSLLWNLASNTTFFHSRHYRPFVRLICTLSADFLYLAQQHPSGTGLPHSRGF